MRYTLDLSEAETQLVLDAVQALPWSRVNGLIHNLSQQISDQQSAARSGSDAIEGKSKK